MLAIGNKCAHADYIAALSVHGFHSPQAAFEKYDVVIQERHEVSADPGESQVALAGKPS
jgi:hypothetical protein